MKKKAAVADADATPNTKTPTVVVAVTTANVAREKGTAGVTTSMAKDVAVVTITAAPQRMISIIRSLTSIFLVRLSLLS